MKTKLIARISDAGIATTAIIVVALLLVKAVVDIDTSHDTWMYQLPWAARLAGIVPASDFIYNDFFQARYDGFPKLGNWLQGFIWWATGRIEAISLVPISSLLLYAVFLRLRYGVRSAIAIMALLAIPLVQAATTSGYMDLPANLALSAAILLTLEFFSKDYRISAKDIILFFFSCATAANMKLQLIPIIALLVTMATPRLFLVWVRLNSPVSKSRIFLAATVIVAGNIVIFAQPAINAIYFKNPFYPIAVELGPISFKGPEGIKQKGNSPSTGGARVAQERPFSLTPNLGSWFKSVLEVDMEPALGNGSWDITSDQDPPLPSRYGGFFGWYVAFQLLVFLWLLRKQPSVASPFVIMFAVTTVIAASMPNAILHRYYLFWMLCLVSSNLILIARYRVACLPRKISLERIYGVIAILFFLVVAETTYRSWIIPRFYTFEDMLADRQNTQVLEEIAKHLDESPLCIAGEREQILFLYSALFTEYPHYRIIMGPPAGDPIDQVAEQCGNNKVIYASYPGAGLVESDSEKVQE